MSTGFIKLHRKILKHDWLNERPEYRVAWEDILLITDYKTGQVVLTDVPAKKFFSSSAWGRFIQRLEDEGMLSQVEVNNRGKRLGKVQTATVTNYHEYHSMPEGANGKATGEHTGEQRESMRQLGTIKTPHREVAPGEQLGEQPGRQVGMPIYKELKEDLKEAKEDLSSSGAPGKTEGLIREKLQGYADVMLAENEDRRKWFHQPYSNVERLVKQASRTHQFKRKLVQLLDLHAGITDFEPTRSSARAPVAAGPARSSIGAGYKFGGKS